MPKEEEDATAFPLTAGTNALLSSLPLPPKLQSLVQWVLHMGYVELGAGGTLPILRPVHWEGATDGLIEHYSTVATICSFFKKKVGRESF